MEHVAPALLHIAGACERVGQALEPWATLRRRLHPRRPVRTDAPPPHWTRFAILPGLTRAGYAPPHWLTRHESPDLLVLTKMMRGADPEDLSDIAFLLQHGPATDAELRATFANVRLPDIHELRDAFRTAQPKVLALAKARGGGGPQTG